jgi:nucleotide-binding universal stress UspA family protein
MSGGMKKIMVGYNIYSTTDDVIRVAKQRAQETSAELLLVSSVVGHSLDASGTLADMDARNRLHSIEASLAADHVPHKVHLIVRGSNAAEDLVRFARENDVAEIVVGFVPRPRIGEMIFGSNHRRFVATAPCPVVTVHNGW